MAFSAILQVDPTMLLIMKDDFYAGHDVIEKQGSNPLEARMSLKKLAGC
jgi:hypothetical protein